MLACQTCRTATRQPRALIVVGSSRPVRAFKVWGFFGGGGCFRKDEPGYCKGRKARGRGGEMMRIDDLYPQVGPPFPPPLPPPQKRDAAPRTVQQKFQTDTVEIRRPFNSVRAGAQTTSVIQKKKKGGVCTLATHFNIPSTCLNALLAVRQN